jgi:hypothetical protein
MVGVGKQRIRSPLTPTYFPFLFLLAKPSPPAGNTLNGTLRRTNTLFYPDPLNGTDQTNSLRNLFHNL